jgi:hypothetical protein
MGTRQMNSAVGHVSANLEHAGELVSAAAWLGAKIVVTPGTMPSGHTLRINSEYPIWQMRHFSSSATLKVKIGSAPMLEHYETKGTG